MLTCISMGTRYLVQWSTADAAGCAAVQLTGAILLCHNWSNRNGELLFPVSIVCWHSYCSCSTCTEHSCVPCTASAWQSVRQSDTDMHACCSLPQGKTSYTQHQQLLSSFCPAGLKLQLCQVTRAERTASSLQQLCSACALLMSCLR